MHPLTLVTTTPINRQTAKVLPKQRAIEQLRGPPLPGQRSLVLCFDGTGNKFQGTAADSNSVLSHLRASIGRFADAS